MGEYDYIRSMSKNEKDLTNKASNGEAASVSPAEEEILNDTSHRRRDEYCKTLYSRYLNRNLGISKTRCESLNEAVDTLHSAVSKLDGSNLRRFDLDQSVGHLLAIFGGIEDLNTFDEVSKEDWNKLKDIQETVRNGSKLYRLKVHNNHWDEELLKPFVPSS